MGNKEYYDLAYIFKKSALTAVLRMHDREGRVEIGRPVKSCFSTAREGQCLDQVTAMGVV